MTEAFAATAAILAALAAVGTTVWAVLKERRAIGQLERVLEMKPKTEEGSASRADLEWLEHRLARQVRVQYKAQNSLKLRWFFTVVLVVYSFVLGILAATVDREMEYGDVVVTVYFGAFYVTIVGAAIVLTIASWGTLRWVMYGTLGLDEKDDQSAGFVRGGNTP